MKRRCELCNKQYNTNQKKLDIILDDKEHTIKTITYRDRTFDLCIDCMRAIVFGVQLTGEYDIRLKDGIKKNGY